MTPIADHPDLERLRQVLDAQNEHADSIEEALDGWIDPGALQRMLSIYVRSLRRVLHEQSMDFGDLAEPKALGRALAASFTSGFLTGAQFQAAGGHREPGSGPSPSEMASAGLDGIYGDR